MSLPSFVECEKNIMLNYFRQLWRRLVRREVFPADLALLRDLGLSPGDLPAIRRGCYQHDGSRRQR